MDIYKLYRREKKISIKDDQGNQLNLILVKPNIGEKEKILTAFTEAKAEAAREIRKSDALMEELNKYIKTLAIEGRVEFLLNNEQSAQEQFSDIVPIGERENMTDEEIKEKEKEFLDKWRAKRKEELTKLSEEDIDSLTRNALIEIRSMLSATEVYNKSLIVYTVRDEKYKQVFRSSEDVDRIQDEEVYNTLKKECNDFIQMYSQKEIRKGAQSKDFLPPSESENNSGGSPTTTI